MAGAKKKIAAALIGSMAGVSGLAASTAILAYDAIFPRLERPDYAVMAGEYCYDRVKDELSRKEFYYPSGKVKLKGYYYEATEARGLVVVVHGFKSGSDNYLPITKYFVENGYNVFSYDCTGTYDSEGDSNIGWCQQLVDLDNTIAYIQRTSPYRNQPLFLLGHSWGGYAVSSVLALKSGIRGVACLAPMNDGSTIMIEKGDQYAGKIAYTAQPIFSVYQRFLFKNYVDQSGVKGINSIDVPVMIAQGVDDKTITYNGQSITAKKGHWRLCGCFLVATITPMRKTISGHTQKLSINIIPPSSDTLIWWPSIMRAASTLMKAIPVTAKPHWKHWKR